MSRKRAFAAALLLTSVLLWRFSSRRVEDFAYYRCAALAEPSYDTAAYIACIERTLGRPLPEPYPRLGFPYSPVVVAFFSAFDGLSDRAAFLAWNAVLLAAAAAALWKAKDPLLLACWPGFILALAYHKWMLVVFAGYLWGGPWLAAAAGHPQWAAALGLHSLLKRRWRELAALGLALAAAALWLQDGAALGRWLESLGRHGNVVTRDNQSLFLLLYRGDLPLWGAEALRYGVGAVLAAGALFLGRRSSEWYLALITLALPYSHASESLWAFPLLAAVCEKKPLWGLGACAYLAFLFKFYPPGNLSDPFHQSVQAWLTLGVAVLAAARGTLIR